MQITFTLSEDQLESLNAYIASASNKTWTVQSNQVVSTPKFASVQELIAKGVSSFLRGIIAQCPPAAALTESGVSQQAVGTISQVEVQAS